MFALPAAMAEGADRLIGIGEQRGSEGIICPGLGHDAGTNLRADLVRIEIDDGIQRRRIYKPLFGQDGLQRLDPQGGLGGQQAVRIVVVMIMWHGGILNSIPRSCPERCAWLARWAIAAHQMLVAFARAPAKTMVTRFVAEETPPCRFPRPLKAGSGFP